MKHYTGDNTAMISFPLGGIGAGCVGLAGNGALVDWEINNRPNRESINPFSGFAIKAEDDARVLDVRFLQGDTSRDFMGGMHVGNHSWGYGQGVNRGTLAGMRHFETVDFSGQYPIADLAYADRRFPGKISLTAFNPFIPSNDFDSSLPCAFFDFDITNTTDKPLSYTLAFSVTNPLTTFGPNEFARANGISMVTMHGASGDESRCEYGNVTLATDCAAAACQKYWYRGAWFDNLTMFLNDFGAYGQIKPRDYAQPAKNSPDTCTLTAQVKLSAGQNGHVRFVLSWYVPNCHKYWGAGAADTGAADWSNYYAKLFDGSMSVAKYCMDNWARLYGDTRMFRDALMTSSLPDSVLDAIQGNIATLKTSVCLRLSDGNFYGWEGVNRTTGSCEGTCQHVWNYAYALPFLFPKLERGVRDDEFRYNFEECGRMRFRMMLPLGSERWNFRACVDGQMGSVMKCYREWKLCGDDAWLRGHWSDIKKCIEFAWSPENEDGWDIGKLGVMTGRQHHTLDVELFGVNSWLTGFYHGALLAGAEMAEAMGEPAKAEEYRALYRKGHAFLEQNAFKGKHYVQLVDISDVHTLDAYHANLDGAANGDFTGGVYGEYWDKETGELKYQIADGCEIDQVLADWHADLLGLGHIFEQAHRKKALQSIYRLNYTSMRDLNNPCRVFACNGENGVSMCAWDEDALKPKIPIPYSEEVMTGFEYACACNMLQCGMEKEALEIVDSIRARYDGKKRNPWAEIECGASYSRAMASYSLLLAYSGFKFDLTRGMLGFKPMHGGKYFWSIDGAWGQVESSESHVRFNVLYGDVALKRFIHLLSKVCSVKLNGAPIGYEINDDEIITSATLHAGDTLEID